MSITPFPNGVSSFGIPLLPSIGGVLTTGDVYFVHSSGSNGNSGTDSDHPFADLDFAVGRCTASKGDVILVMPGHTENISAADDIDVDVAGVSVIGLGSGNLRPTFTYTNALGEFVVGASNVRISNMIFNASVTTVPFAIDVEDDCTGAIIDHCRFGVDTGGTDEFSDSITINDQCNNYLISHCEFHQGTAAAVSAIYLDADTDYGTIEYCFTSGDYSTACIAGDEQDDMIHIHHNMLYNGRATGIELNSEPCIELHANTTGVIAYNLCACNLATKAASIVADDCHLHENYYNEDESGGATSGIIGTASADD